MRMLCIDFIFNHFSQFLIKQYIIVHFSISIISISWLTHSFAQTHPSLHLFDHLLRVLVHSFDKGAHVLGVHVGVKAVAQVGDVALRAETLQHLLHDF